MMTALLSVLLLLLAVSSTAFTTTDVYYVTADDAEHAVMSSTPVSRYMPQPLLLHLPA